MQFLRFAPVATLAALATALWAADPWPTFAMLSLLVLVPLSVVVSNTQRSCGHGSLLPLFGWPWAVSACPKCGAKEW